MATIILGAGAFAREAHDWLRQAGVDVVGFYAEGPAQPPLRGLPVHRSIDALPAGAVWTMGVGSPKLGHRLANQVTAVLRPAPAVVHPTATRGTNVEIGDGSIVCPGVVLTCDIHVGRGVVLNLGCTVGHDSRIGDFCNLSPHATLSGRTTVGRGASLGSACTIVPGVRVPDFSVVGAGAVLVNDVAAGTIVGVPARTIKPLESGSEF